MLEDAAIPSYDKLMWPTLCAVRDLGGSGTIGEIVATVVKREGFTQEQQAMMLESGRRGMLESRLSWARTYLGMTGLLENSKRGVWSITDSGRAATEAIVEEKWSQRAQVEGERKRTRRRERAAERDGDSEGLAGDEAAGEDESDEAWRSELLARLLELSPDAFERLAQRLLREAGFISVSVTGRSGDGGIDGLGVFQLSLVSFPIFFQCKRYRGSVGAREVRDFRGAMAGRGDKGLLITTASFTSEAKVEATRDGAPPIDLIDGERLCDLLAQYELGVSVSERTVREHEVEHRFFDEL